MTAVDAFYSLGDTYLDSMEHAESPSLGVYPANGDDKVPVKGSATVRPDPSGYKDDEFVSSTLGRETRKLVCPVIVDGQPLNGIKFVSFFKALENCATLACPTQLAYIDYAGGTGRCMTKPKNARGSDFDYFEKK
jgi:hypothetical protein